MTPQHSSTHARTDTGPSTDPEAGVRAGPAAGSRPDGGRRPGATYRLQLRPEFPFAAAGAVVPYLASLGVTHLHLSPVLEAVPGSAHGYDVVDHTRVREELGGEAGLRALSATARRHGLGLVLDIVPNHMAVPSPLRLNGPLWEVLRAGPGSPYARWFDIDWPAGGGQVLLPVLPGPLADCAPHVRDGVLVCGGREFPLREGTAGLPMPELLARQWYRPAWWREARTALNYRRFFTIAELIGVRMEDPEVFAATHGKVLELVRDGVAEGLRIDHVDGLADPGGYLRRLRREVGGECWVVVEKILAEQERLPSSWAGSVAGTTGYDALRRLDGLFTDPQGARELARSYAESTGLPDWEETADACARAVLTVDLAAELATLGRMAGAELLPAVTELLIDYPVYRSYPDDPGPSPEAVRRAESRVAARDLDAVARLLGSDGAFAARFAQTSAALRAKSLEDRAFYRYAPLLSANEVGGEPGRPAVPVEEFHAYCARIERDWPATGTVLSTHDTKRSADVRARIAALSQDPAAMGRPAGADPQLAWVARQTSLGLGPAPDREPRLTEALLKSVREAALRTSWTEPDEAYEEQVGAHVPAEAELPEHLAEAARVTMLGLTLLHLTMPGVPEVYQGCETDCRTLVDPDNRRPVRFPEEALARLSAGAAPAGPAEEKLALTTALLRLRRDRPELFTDYVPLAARGPAADHLVAYGRGVSGGHGGHGGPGEAGEAGEAGGPGLVAVATRLSYRLDRAGGWGPTVLPLPPGDWSPLLGPPGARHRGEVAVAELLRTAPVTLLLRRGTGG
ncbi:malto-oligosyltrehalose synthase [Streptomyces antimicrobicus]|uniref:Malto-oligosyltrehalose synthase n=1 Tax=Streptomyces antimicrobicus TaxID=2883108 RepID=A0ABS8B4M3_9ACTN|nr:malto-oligosyltrehalose synthase [Streptomyces antimicrobicus]MCB5179575.1 malto-oligosyltrehalose synthase [Streptomyces antimicrobicus]